MDPTDRLVPRLYLGFAFLSLASAGAAFAWDPAALVGFFYHPRLLAVVHLITVGWLTGSLLGLLHLASPRLLGKAFPTSRVDFLVFGLFFLSTSGMVGHFWIREMSGVGWSGALVVLVVLRIGVRFLVELVGASPPAPVFRGFTLCSLLALLNLVGAATLGIAIVLDRYMDVLPGFVLHHVFAHAHLAALGWATLLLLGLVGVLRGGSVPSDATALFLIFEMALLALVVAFLAKGGHGLAALAVAAVVFFLAIRVAGDSRVFRFSDGAARSLPAERWRHFELRQSLVYLLLTCLLGGGMAWIPEGEFKLRVFLVYGTFGLLGFLGALPFVLLRSFEGAEDSSLGILGRWLFCLSVPFLAAGFAWQSLPALRAGGWALLVAAVVAWRRPWPVFTRNQNLRDSP